MINTKYVNPGWKEAEKKSLREGYGDGMVEVGRENEKAIALTADLEESTRLTKFRENFPGRFFNVGIAEQNMVGIAAGMALEGYVPFTASFGVFSPGRSWDQVRVSVANNNANVKMIGSHAGISVGEDGVTQQATEDIGIVRVLPGLAVISPCDYEQTFQATKAMAETYGPMYMRFPRVKSANFTKEEKFTIGKAYVYREGKDVSVMAHGLQVWDSLMVAERLEQEGVSVEVINVPTLKPLDVGTIVASAKKTGKVVTVEDHQIIGGLGSAVAEVLGEQLPTPMVRIGMEDKFGESGNWEELYKKYGLDQEGIYRKVKGFVGSNS